MQSNNKTSGKKRFEEEFRLRLSNKLMCPLQVETDILEIFFSHEHLINKLGTILRRRLLDLLVPGSADQSGINPTIIWFKYAF